MSRIDIKLWLNIFFLKHFIKRGRLSMGDRDNGMTDDEFEPSGEDSSSGDESQSSSEVSDDVIPVSRRRGRPSQVRSFAMRGFEAGGRCHSHQMVF